MGAPDADLPQPRHETAVACEDYHRLLVCPGEQKFDCLAANRFTMSAQEIIAKLSKLEPVELQLVKQKLQEWESLAQHETRPGGDRRCSRSQAQPKICRPISR